MKKKYHIFYDFGIYKGNYMLTYKEWGINDPEVESLLAQKTHRYTLAEFEKIFKYLWTPKHEYIIQHPKEFHGPNAHNAALRIKKGKEILDKLEMLQEIEG